MTQRFRLYVSRYIEQSATIDVDAVDKSDAEAQASNIVRSGAMLAWTDGDHAILTAVYDIEELAREVA